MDTVDTLGHVTLNDYFIILRKTAMMINLDGIPERYYCICKNKQSLVRCYWQGRDVLYRKGKI